MADPEKNHISHVGFGTEDYRTSFRFTGNPDIAGPDPVPAGFTPTGEIMTHGGGTEYFIREIARIKLIGAPIPLGP